MTPQPQTLRLLKTYTVPPLAVKLLLHSFRLLVVLLISHLRHKQGRLPGHHMRPT